MGVFMFIALPILAILGSIYFPLAAIRDNFTALFEQIENFFATMF